MSRKVGLIIQVILLVIYFILSVWQFYRNPEMRVTGDLWSYYRVADTPIMSKNFWCGGERPPGLPLVYKVLDIFHTRQIEVDLALVPAIKGFTPQLIGLVQLVFSIFSWSYLAVVIANGVKTTKLKPVALVLILLYSFTNNFTPFIKVIVSESLTSSLFICLITSWILFLRKSNLVRFTVLLLTSFFLAIFRDSFAYLLLMASCIIFLWLIICWLRGLQQRNNRLLVIAIVYVVFFLANDHCLSNSKRWLSPFYHNLSARILTNNDHIEFFRVRGMPVNEALMHLDEWVHSENKFYKNSPEQSDIIRNWVVTKGKSTYESFLIQHPAYTLLQPIKDLPYILTGDFTDDAYYEKIDFKPFPVIGQLTGHLKYFLRDPDYRGYLKLVLVLFCFVFFLGVFLYVLLISAKNMEAPLFVTSMFMILTVLPHFLIVWHSDPVAVERHSLFVAIQFQLAFLMLAILLIDSFFIKYSQQKRVLLEKTK